jgi:dTDP-4-amino-4,6-dideoxygalactose transaminase
MVTTNDEGLWRAMWSIKDHGKSYEAVYERQHPPGFRWLHESFGTNWRMLEMQAVIGRVQLTRMPEWAARRQANAVALAQALQPFAGERGPVRVPHRHCTCCATGCADGGAKPSSAGCVHAQYKFYAHVRPQNLERGWSRDRIVHAINEAGVPCYQGSCSEVYLEKAFDGTGWRPTERLPVARALGETSLMFLVHPTLTSQEIEKTCKVAARVLTEAANVPRSNNT